MSLRLLSLPALITLAIVVFTIFIIYRLQSLQSTKKSNDLDFASSLSEPAVLLSKKLKTALPEGIALTHDDSGFKQLLNSHWAQQECEAIPACIIRPQDVQQLSIAVAILEREHEGRKKQAVKEKENAEGLFAVRSGGHSPVSGAASIKGGVVIDLSLFCEVTPSQDGSSVVLGTGAKWMDVSRVLDEKGLAVAGGRNSAVGVGGLTLGGKLSACILVLRESWRARPAFHCFYVIELTQRHE